MYPFSVLTALVDLQEGLVKTMPRNPPKVLLWGLGLTCSISGKIGRLNRNRNYNYSIVVVVGWLVS